MKMTPKELEEYRAKLLKEELTVRIQKIKEGGELSPGRRTFFDRDEALTKEDKEFDKSFSIARYIRGSLGMGWDDAGFEKEQYTEIHKALAEQRGSTGGFLVPEQYAQTLIPLLRAKSVVRAAGATVYPMNSDTLNLPKQSGASGTAWGAENALFTEDTNPTFEQKTLVLKASRFHLRFQRND